MLICILLVDAYNIDNLVNLGSTLVRKHRTSNILNETKIASNCEIETRARAHGETSHDAMMASCMVTPDTPYFCSFRFLHHRFYYTLKKRNF
jgi:hypothetical protein